MKDLVAGIVHLVSVRTRWKRLLAPLWLVAGASALCLVFLAADIVREMPLQSNVVVTHAPAVVFGSWLCAAALTLLSASYVTPVVWRGRRSHGRWKTTALLVVVASLVLIASVLAQQGLRALTPL